MAVCTQIQEGRLVHAFGHSVLIGSLWSPMHTVLFPHGGLVTYAHCSVGSICLLPRLWGGAIEKSFLQHEFNGGHKGAGSQGHGEKPRR